VIGNALRDLLDPSARERALADVGTSLLPWRPKPFHPNAEGMRAVADLVVTAGGTG
jgi:hypothetical protein